MNSTDSGAPHPAAAISEEAAQWWVTLHSEHCTADEHRAFAEWVTRSPERVEAYLRLVSLNGALRSGDVRWPDIPADALIEEAKTADAEVVQLERKLPFEARRRTALRRPLLVRLGRTAVAGAAAVLAIVIVATWIYMRRPEHYQTALGEQRSVVLDDGSVITLNTSSQVDVDFRRERRLVHLVRGEALFKVAPDRQRPFEVVADTAVIRAVGTRFNVDLRRDRTTVTVLEGHVVVRERAADSERPLQKPAAPTMLAPAERITVTAVGRGPLQRIENVAPVTAWTQRRLIFDDRPIGEVADEFNRYNRLHVVVTDPELRRQKITGVFDTNDPESFLTFLSQIPAVRIDQSDAADGLVTVRAADLRPEGAQTGR
jgi:transmembrane sensor